MFGHCALTIVAPLVEGVVPEDVRDALDTLGRRLDVEGERIDRGEPPLDAEMRALLELDRIHYMSWFVIRPGTGGQPACVGLEVNADGSKGALRRDLVRLAPELLKQLFGSCVRFADVPVARFLRIHDVSPNAFYIGTPGRKVRQIRQERGLRAALRTAVQSGPARPKDPDRLETARADWQAAVGRLDADQRRELDRVPRRPFWVRFAPRPEGLGRVMAAVRARARPVLLTLGGVLGLAAMALDFGAHPRLYAWLLAIAGGLAVAYAIAWWSVAPRQTSLRGLGVVARTFVVDWLLWCVTWFGAAGLVVSLGLATPWLPAVAAALVSVAGALACAATATAFYIAIGAVGWLAGGLVFAGWVALVLRFFDEPLTLLGCGVLGYGLFAVVFCGVWKVWLWRRRRWEQHDTASDLSWDLEHFARVTRYENRWIQNHVINVSELRPERAATLRRVLRGVAVLARVYFNRGYLGGLPTIHYARFIILKGEPNRERLLFMSNYDGAFGLYLEDFNSVIGATAVWSNTFTFPATRFLLQGGTWDEQRFKVFARHIQEPTLGWYGPYRDLMVGEIDKATELREALGRPVDGGDRNPASLLERTKGAWSRPGLTEAECDALLRKL